MKVREIMTPDVQCVGPEENLADAAALMRQLDVGVLPVCEGDALLGIVTDRDIVIRCVADGHDARQCLVRDVMSADVVCVGEGESIEHVVRLMEKHQIRRAPVVNRERKLVGIISIGDIAVGAGPELSGEALKDISQPAEPVR